MTAARPTIAWACIHPTGHVWLLGRVVGDQIEATMAMVESIGDRWAWTVRAGPGTFTSGPAPTRQAAQAAAILEIRTRYRAGLEVGAGSPAPAGGPRP